MVPEDQRIKHDILIPPGEGRRRTGAGGRWSKSSSSRPRHTQPLGRVVEVLGEIDDPGMEIEIAVRKFDVPHEFSAAALQQAEKLPARRCKAADLKGRVDLRDVPLVTIDGEDARDFDDAVYLRAGRARYRQTQATGLAPVGGHRRRQPLCPPGDALDDGRHRARHQRVFSAPGHTHVARDPVQRPLLAQSRRRPAGAGLRHGDSGQWRQGRQRHRLSVLRCGHAFACAHYLYRSLGGAAAAHRAGGRKPCSAVLPHLQNLYELYQLLAQARKKRGAIDFDTVETRIVCNELGRIEKIEAYTRNDAHKLIEECMLAANTCAAEFMARNKHLGLYRVHEGPTPPKLKSLRDYLRNLGLTLGGGEDPTTDDYAKLVQSVRSRPDFAIIQTMCLRSLQQAMYSPDKVGHFGLSYDHYAHFTSPIRRYPDLLTHRVIKGILRGKRYVPQARRYRQSCGPAERRARACGLGKARPVLLSATRAPRRRRLARCRGMAQVLVRQGTRRRRVQRHG